MFSSSVNPLPLWVFSTFFPVDIRAVCPGSCRSEPEDDWLCVVFFFNLTRAFSGSVFSNCPATNREPE